MEESSSARAVCATPLPDETSTDDWSSGWAAPPAGVDFRLTEACDLSCDYCPLWGEDSLQPRPRIMNTAQALRLIDELASFRPWVRLFGGESLLHPHWRRIVERAREREMWSAAVSNGQRISRLAEDLVGSGLRIIGISLDGPEDVNDGERGAGGFETIRRGLERLAEVKARRGIETPLVEIYTTVHAGSAPRLIELAEELARWGVWKYRLQHLIWYSSRQFERAMSLLHATDRDFELVGDDLYFRRDQISGVEPAVLSEQLTELFSREWPFELEMHPNLSLDELARYHTDPEYERRTEIACRALDGYVYIEPDGSVRPCMSLQLGNVFERPFLEIWNGERFRAFRRLIRSRGRLPICHRCPCG